MLSLMTKLSARVRTATAMLVIATAPAYAESQTLFSAAYSTGFEDLDPSTSFSSENAVLANVYEPLVWYKAAAADQPPVLLPGLAKEWSQSADGKAWTFKLQDGVVFHDGEKFDSAAVKFSIERTQKTKGGAAWIWDALESIETPDPLTVLFKLKKPAPIDLIASSTYAAWMISPKSGDKDNAWYNAGNDAGTGPYKIKSYKPNQQVLLERNEQYWRGWKDKQVSLAVFDVVEDATLRQQKIESGESDWVQQIPTDNLDAFKANPNVSLVVNSSLINVQGLINTKKKPLDDPRVRQAISYAFPYDDVVNSVMGGYATQARGILPQGMEGADPDGLQYTLDLQKSEKLLKEAGVDPSTLSLTLTYSIGDAVQQQIAELYKASLANIGVVLDVQPMSWPARSSLARSDPAKAQDIFLLKWWPTYVTPYDYLANMFKTEQTPIFNLAYYNNPDFDQLLEKANDLQGVDKAAALEQFKKAQATIVNDAVALFMFDQKNAHLVSNKVSGYVDQLAYGEVVFLYDLSKEN